MAYNAVGNRPFERASRSAHHHIINDPEVQSLLAESWLPEPGAVSETDWTIAASDASAGDDIEHVIAVDGSFAESVVRPTYPSSVISFMQFGALSFRRADLDRLDSSPHPAPEDMERLRNLERLKLAYPVRGVRLKGQASLVDSVRLAIYRFFLHTRIESLPLIDTIGWTVFERYRPSRERPRSWHLATNPTDTDWRGADLREIDMSADYTFPSSGSASPIYLTDIFRLHEKVDEETGAGGIAGHLIGVIEQFLLLHIMRLIHQQSARALDRCLFLRDGPLAFFGQTAPLHAPFRAALEWMRRSASIYLVGVEKSGPFVDHAKGIATRLEEGDALILTDEYIYKYVIPKDITASDIYGRNTYYGRKVIYRARGGGVHVLTIPTAVPLAKPVVDDLQGFSKILSCIEKLRCDMYDSALFPVALANKLVSLSAHPSQRILQRFAATELGY